MKVPDNWDSDQVASYIIHQCVDAGAEFTRFFGPYLELEGVKNPSLLENQRMFDRGMQIDQAHKLAILGQAAKVAELYYKGIASLTPGGLAVVAAYDASNGDYKAAALEAAFLIPYGALVQKGLAYISLEGPAGQVLQVSTSAIKAFRNLPINKQASVLQALTKTKNIDEACVVINRELEGLGIDTADVAYAKGLSNFKGEAGEAALFKRIQELQGEGEIVIKAPAGAGERQRPGNVQRQHRKSEPLGREVPDSGADCPKVIDRHHWHEGRRSEEAY